MKHFWKSTLLLLIVAHSQSMTFAACNPALPATGADFGNAVVSSIDFTNGMNESYVGTSCYPSISVTFSSLYASGAQRSDCTFQIRAESAANAAECKARRDMILKLFMTSLTLGKKIHGLLVYESGQHAISATPATPPYYLGIGN